MTAALAFLLEHWQKVGIGLLLVTAVLGVRGCMNERDARIRSEAVAEERMDDFLTADRAYQEVAMRVGEMEAQRVQDSLRIACLIEEAEDARETAREAAEEASQQAIETGETLRQTLRATEDSTALRQWREHLAADQRTRQAHREEMEAVESERDLWKLAAERANEWGSEQYNLRRAAEAALDEARAALESRAEVDGDPWYDHWTVDVVTHAGAAYAGYEAGRRW